MDTVGNSLFSKVRRYHKLSRELQEYLSRHPNEWAKYQEMFNSALDKISLDVMRFENENISKSEAKIYKLRKIFEKRYRSYFLYGDLAKWSFEKPFGYPGDFKIIDEIYQNRPRTTGYDRLWDNYFLQLPASKATRERKEDFKKIIFDFVNGRKGQNTRVMNLACGPTREIRELLDKDKEGIFPNVIFDCYDFCDEAINFAKNLLNTYKNINFIQKNAIRLALKKDIIKEIQYDYDLIYSTGLFDYLDERLAIRLAGNLKNLLKKGGLMVVSNYREKRYNSSVYLMEWVTEWNLIYRSEQEFKKIFLDAGFSEDELNIQAQKSAVMQYCLASMR